MQYATQRSSQVVTPVGALPAGGAGMPRPAAAPDFHCGIKTVVACGNGGRDAVVERAPELADLHVGLA
jgi:hypothetical protein